MVAGMPAMLRARFSTPTIGREAMIGELGAASAAVDPEGTVRVRGALWRARTNRATPIAAGDIVRVVAIDGLLLEVEPEVGGAREARH
jgi:membrane-bound serine protease (ClpP class)